jgi:PBP1b-binding outer membrane lipoprotein LpoB
MKKIIIVVCVLVLFLTSCTLATSQANATAQTPAADSSSKTAIGNTPASAKSLAVMKRPTSADDKNVAMVQKVFNDYLSGKIKMVDANKQLGAIAKKIGNVPLAWIVRNLK